MIKIRPLKKDIRDIHNSDFLSSSIHYWQQNLKRHKGKKKKIKWGSFKGQR